MIAIERYQQLMKERPEEFRQSNKGLIHIVTNKKTLEDYQENHPERQIGVVYESPFHLMVVDLIDNGSGKYYTYERILKQDDGSAVVFPIAPDGKIVLLRQFRHAMREEQISLPRGFGRKGYTAEDNARKEADEEINADDTKPILLGEIVANSGLSGVKVKVYLFKIHNYRTAYGNEGIVEALAVTKDELKKLILDGKINDGFTLSAWTLYETKMNSK